MKSESDTGKEAADVFVDEPLGGSIMNNFIRSKHAANTQWKSINDGNTSSENKSSTGAEQGRADGGS